MKKSYIIGFAFVWLFIFSFAAQASTVPSGKRQTISAPRLTEATKGAEENRKEASKAEIGKAESNKEEADKPEAETLVPIKELLKYVDELEENLVTVENTTVEKIGSLTWTEGISKKRVKLFAGVKKLLAKGEKNNQINLVLFRVSDDYQSADKEVVILQENSYEIGASRLFSAEVALDRIGLNYLLIQVESDDQITGYQLYQIIVEDIKTKDKLESMTLQFGK